MEKFCRARHAADDNMAHAGYLRLQIHTQVVVTSVALTLHKWLLEGTVYVYRVSC